MKKVLGIITLFLLVTASFANAASFTNAGFESGTTDWFSAGNLSAVGPGAISAGPNIWEVTPFETQMGVLFTTTNSQDISILDSAISAPAGTIAGLVSGAVNGSIAYQDVTLAGPSDSITEYWAFVTKDGEIYNDSAFILLLDSSNNLVGSYVFASVVSGSPFIVGDFGATGWHFVGFTGAAAGTYRVAFGVVNVADNEVDSYLFLDNGRGTLQNLGGEVPEPATMLLLGSGLLGLWGFRKKFKK